MFCSKLGDEKKWVNPVDPSGTNYHPPQIVFIDRPVFNAYPVKSFDFSVLGEDNEDSIAEYFWSLDNGITWKSTAQVSHISVSWDTSSTGPKKILAYITDNHGLKSRVDTINVFVHRYEPVIDSIIDKFVSQKDTVKQVLSGKDIGASSLRYYWDVNNNGWDDSLFAEKAECSISRPEGGTVFVHWAIRDESNFVKNDTFMIYFNRKPFPPKVVSPAKDTIKNFILYDYAKKNGTVQLDCAASDPDDSDSTLTLTLRYGIKDSIIDSITVSNRKINLSRIKELTVYSYKLTVADDWKNSAFTEGQFIVLPPLPVPEGMKFVQCRDIVFQMGQHSKDSTSLPVRNVRLTKNFCIDSSEVTVEQFTKMLKLPPQLSSPRLPVTNITWFDAVLYCNARSKSAKLDTVYKFSSVTGTPGLQCKLENVISDPNANGYRLPTEAEWEFACRAGTSTRFYWGNDLYRVSDYAWTYSSPESKIHEIASLKPNSLDIYDMAGNVWEWCNDWYGIYQKSAIQDPTGALSGTERVLRGGSAASTDYFIQSGIRSKLRPETYNAFTGFRTVLPAP